MFGLSTFAQSPYASLGGSYFPFSLTEDVGMADANSVTANFVQSLTEPVTMADINEIGRAHV